MRILAERPASIVDPSSRAVRPGSYRGGVPPIDGAALARGRVFRLKHEKRWIYASVAAGDLLVGAAVVRLGYAANGFAFAFDRAAGRITARTTAVAPPHASKVGLGGGEGAHARFTWGGTSIAFERGRGERDYRLEIHAPELRVSARLGTEGAPPEIGAVAHLAGPAGLFNCTQKGSLLPVVGEALVAGKHHDLGGGLGGYDFTGGLLPRHTAWRWAWALGRARTAERVGLNLVQGFVGEPECAVWIDGELVPVSEGRIELDRDKPLAPWTVRTVGGEVDLRFTPADMHAEERDFKLLRSHFLQPCGAYSGTIRLPGRKPLELDEVLGVVEDQDVLW
jgi:hypothetical protein